MFARFALLLFVCALIVPRTAWGAHMAGHEELSAATAVHTHHAEHSHEHDDDAAEQALADQQDEDGSLTHEHSPSFALASGVVIPDEVGALALLSSARNLLVAREMDFTALRRPESLLRPPRLA